MRACIPQKTRGIEKRNRWQNSNMQLKFYFDNKGRIFSSGRGKAKPARTYPVELTRSGTRVTVYLQKSAGEQALLSLMNHTRSMKQFDFMLNSELEELNTKRYESVEPFCLDLGLACLSLFEGEDKGGLNSNVSLWDKTELDTAALPFDMLNLSQQRLIHLDTPSALASLPEKLTQNAALYRFSAERQLVLIKLPKTVKPDTTELVSQPQLEDIIDDRYIRWLSICGHTTLAVGTPLCQQGQVIWQMRGQDKPQKHPFIRLLYPLTSPYERPNNYRLITITYLTDIKKFIL